VEDVSRNDVCPVNREKPVIGPTLKDLLVSPRLLKESLDHTLGVPVPDMGGQILQKVCQGPPMEPDEASQALCGQSQGSS